MTYFFYIALGVLFVFILTIFLSRRSKPSIPAFLAPDLNEPEQPELLSHTEARDHICILRSPGRANKERE